MKIDLASFEIDDNLLRIDFSKVCAWMTSTYWSRGYSRELEERAARHSALVIGVYAPDGSQVGYARVVSDTVKFAYLADVYVDESVRGRGIAKGIVAFVLAHPLLADVPHVTLKTSDAHSLYSKFGFEPIRDTDRWMRRVKDEGAC
jgi:GNAT superfamily N-acetyltransferase